MTEPYIIFSDLDGTLLDYHTYSFESAQPALDKIREKEIPLVLVSSKTRREMIFYQEMLDLTGLPFVVENGSAIFTSPGYFSGLGSHDVSGNYDRYALGKTYNEIESNLKTISEKHDYIIRGFHNASQLEIKDKTGLSDDQLQMALSREFSIPLFFDDRAEVILKKEINNFGLKVLYGGRFMHLLSQRENRYDIKSIAFGDSLNDFAMLEAADHPFLVKKHDGSYERRQILESVIYSPGIGPEGWNQSMTTFLATGGNNE
jgi:mannosyl-3-phosphoglycerate phosphatase